MNWRNPDANGDLRQPLLASVHTRPRFVLLAPRISFGVATFEELAFTGIYEDLIESLRLTGFRQRWLAMFAIFWVSSPRRNGCLLMMFRARGTLLTALENGIDGETL